MNLTKLFVSTFSILVLTSCNQDLINPKETKKISENIVFINSIDEPLLLEKIDLLFKSDNGRIAASDINWDRAVKVTDDIHNTTLYSFEYSESNSVEISNFVLSEINSVVSGYTLTYTPSNEWFSNDKFDLLNFNGTISGISLAGDTISHSTIVNGTLLETLDKSNGRVTTAALPPIPGGEGCYELIYSETTGSYWWNPIACSGSSSSGTGGTTTTGGTGRNYYWGNWRHRRYC